MIYNVLLFKFLMADSMLKWCRDHIDTKSDTIQIIQNVGYIDRYVIYENKDGQNTIFKTIKYMNDNKETISQISLPQNLILKCEFNERNVHANLPVGSIPYELMLALK